MARETVVERRDDPRPAAIMSDSGETLSYAALERASIRLARLLRARGLDDGDRVAILMENNLAWFVAMWGVRRANMFFVPVNWHLKVEEVRYVLDNSDARCLITSKGLADLARAASDGLDAIETRLSVGGAADGFEDFDAAIASFTDEAPEGELDGGSMPYSSGTTGFPKGIMRALTGDAFGTYNSLEVLLCGLYKLDRDSIYLSPAPLYHSSPVGWTGAVLVSGGTVVAMPSFDAEGVLAAIDRYGVTHAQFVPTHFVRMLRLPDDVRQSYDLSSLETAVHAAAPCAPDVKQAVIEWFGPIVHEYYAGSERCGFTAIDSAEWLAHRGSVGRSLTGPIHILDPESGAELPAGEIGVIYFENAIPFTYHKDPAKTAESLRADGWGTHGDVGRLDAEGYLYMSDRRSDLILSGGVNIYPQEIENVLLGHSSVADAAVIGVPDPEFGQQVKAVIELRPGADAPDPAALIGWCRERLAGFKCPRSVDVVDRLPRLPNGKLLRRELVERFRNTPAPAVHA